MQANKSTSNRFHLRFYVSLSPSLRLSLSLSLSFFIALRFFLVQWKPRGQQNEKHNANTTSRSYERVKETRREADEEGEGRGGTSGLAKSTWTIVLPQRIFLWLFASCVIKSSHKALLRASANKLCCHFRTCLFLAPPTAYTNSPTPHLTPALIQPVVCEKFTQLLQNTAGTNRCESEWGREREIEVPILLAVTLPNKLFVRLSRTHINWIGPKNFLF